MIDSVKCFLEVDEDTACIFSIVKSLPYVFCDANKCMVS